ncbi:hypothetical protein HPB51_005214 [Rhipicephalus microplus]|uniref:CCHC-type domain-containing protein n=1 Tax=Rhipicephalus microplus TaxID=6941 RepID=A0A9J6E755_RHIMP|nr:hypothetical protein HPB51_005214 [Rhipicephalus microplus]
MCLLTVYGGPPGGAVCLAGRIQCSTFTCSWPVTGPRPCLDKLTIPSGRLPGHADNIRAPVRPQAGPPGPFKSTKRRGAALTLTRRACTSTMQSPAQHSTPTTTYALSVSPASSGRTPDTAVPPLSPSGNVTSPAPTTIQQQAAFLNSAHGPATCNAGGVSATLSLIATQTPEPESRNAALALQSTTPAALPTLSASGLPIGNSESVDKRVSTSVVPSIAEVLPSITSADDLSTEMDFTASQVNEDNTPSPEGSWNTVSANRKPASTARPRSELITVGIQLPPGTLTPKLPLYDLLSTITAAANLSPKTSAEVTLQAKPAQSLVFLKTHSPLTAHLLLSLTSLELNGKPITIKPYALSPPISCLGVIHNVGGHFTTSQLLHDLESFTSDILAARMMGSTESVLITFAGTIIPRFVYFKRVSFRCRPHKPKPPTCTRCLAIGHRAHQCPQHSVPAKCRRCASPLPADPDAHVCAQPWCIHCQVNTHSSLDSTCPYLLAKQRDCAKAAFLRRTAMRRATQPSPPSSSAHELLSPPATSPPGSYAAKVKGTPPMCTSSSNTPSPSSSNESRSFDLRLAMLERNQREQQRVSDELQQKILALTQTLATTTSSLTSQLTELNKQLTTLTAPTSSSHVTKLADMVETTTTAHHTRLVQLGKFNCPDSYDPRNPI